MTSPGLRLAERAEELRRAFDQSFAESALVKQAPLEDFLAIGVGTDPYAVRLAEVSTLLADRPITRLPSPIPELLGIAGFRSAIVPVYDLRALLGYSVGSAARWLMIAAAMPVALAFDAFDGHFRLPLEARERESRNEPARQHVREVVRAASVVRPVVHLASVLEEIKKRAQPGVPQQER